MKAELFSLVFTGRAEEHLSKPGTAANALMHRKCAPMARATFMGAATVVPRQAVIACRTP
jgi:hypothetical protein